MKGKIKGKNKIQKLLKKLDPSPTESTCKFNDLVMVPK